MADITRSIGRPLRLWPGTIAASLLVVVWLVAPVVVSGWGGIGMLGGVALGLVILLWWLFFSRARWAERIGAVAVMIVALAATSQLVHESISNGLMGFMLIVYGIPTASLGLVVWAVASRRRVGTRRWTSMIGTIALACLTLAVIRTNGVDGDGGSDFAWRWTPTAEDRLLALPPDEPVARAEASTVAAAPVQPATTPDAAAGAAPAGSSDARPSVGSDDTTARERSRLAADAGIPWPGFRGRHRDGVIHGVRIDTNWTASPPVEIWRRPIGPGWSSFAFAGSLIYTQEQRGDDELVSAYRASTGEPVWRHRDRARFWESNAGPGPRGTPTVEAGRLYALGATGILNALDAATGSVVWTRNAVADTRTTVPEWGIAGSPLVVGDAVIVASAGVLAAYDRATGTPRWIGSPGGWGYASPHVATIDGVPQVVLLNGAGAIGVSPADGTPLWTHEWTSDGILQPVALAGGDLLLGSGSGLNAAVGVRRFSVIHSPAGWKTEARWTSNGLKPYFNDVVVHKGHAFGFDGGILACIDLADGSRRWKGGRYGHGQLVLLADQDLLLVLSEEGELALVMATADRFTEVARAPAISGKTWNHPVLVGDTVYVRNGEEMAAFRLALAAR